MTLVHSRIRRTRSRDVYEDPLHDMIAEAAHPGAVSATALRPASSGLVYSSPPRLSAGMAGLRCIP
jgi:hypothetical protein